jgi:hypothetical protein
MVESFETIVEGLKVVDLLSYVEHRWAEATIEEVRVSIQIKIKVLTLKGGSLRGPSH